MKISKAGNTIISKADCPSRFVITSNLLLPVVRNNEGGLIMYNFDPINWNQFYPVFSFHHHDIDISCPVAESELIESVISQENIFNSYDSAMNGRGLSEKASDDIGLKGVVVEPKPIVEPFFELKFSKSRHMMSMYCHFYHRAVEIDIESIYSALGLGGVAFVPYGIKELGGTPVVENISDILSEAGVLKELRKYSVVI